MKLPPILILGSVAALLVAAALYLFSLQPSPSPPQESKAPSIIAPSPPYPLDTCVVSGRKLGSMGPVFATNHHGTVVKMCCHRCLPEFAENTEKYLLIVKESIQQSRRPADQGAMEALPKKRDQQVAGVALGRWDLLSEQRTSTQFLFGSSPTHYCSSPHIVSHQSHCRTPCLAHLRLGIKIDKKLWSS